MVEFNFIAPATLRQRNRLRAFVQEQIRRSRQIPGDLSINFCSDEYLLSINREYLRHNNYTDIITFDHTTGNIISGELFISIDRVRENAKTFGVPTENELHRVIFHGILHLLGFRDKSGEEKKQMRRMEDQWLKRYATFHVER